MRALFIILSTLIIHSLSYGQNNEPTYTIHNDTVIYEFNPEQLDSLYTLPFSLIQDFDSLKMSKCIDEKLALVPLQDGWNFHYIDKEKVRVTKHLDEFKDEYSFLEKYLLLPEYWKYPRSQFDTTNVRPEPVFTVDQSGNVVFSLEEHLQADQVILAGSFNQWNEEELRMRKTNSGWELTLQLQPGIYEYKFIVDGDWTHDLKNPLKLKNEHQTLNSILLVGEKVSFSLKDDEKAKKVFLAGSFNNWDKRSIPMKKSGDLWTVDLELPPGKHYYKFIVDRNWIVDEKNELREQDEYGQTNSVLLVN